MLSCNTICPPLSTGLVMTLSDLFTAARGLLWSPMMFHLVPLSPTSAEGTLRALKVSRSCSIKVCKTREDDLGFQVDGFWKGKWSKFLSNSKSLVFSTFCGVRVHLVSVVVCRDFRGSLPFQGSPALLGLIYTRYIALVLLYLLLWFCLLNEFFSAGKVF